MPINQTDPQATRDCLKAIIDALDDDTVLLLDPENLPACALENFTWGADFLSATNGPYEWWQFLQAVIAAYGPGCQAHVARRRGPKHQAAQQTARPAPPVHSAAAPTSPPQQPPAPSPPPTTTTPTRRGSVNPSSRPHPQHPQPGGSGEPGK